MEFTKTKTKCLFQYINFNVCMSLNVKKENIFLQKEIIFLWHYKKFVNMEIFIFWKIQKLILNILCLNI